MKRSALLVLTPGIDGADGLSLLSREVISALSRLAPGSDVSIWSLTDEPLPGRAVRCARGSRVRFGLWGLEEALFLRRRWMVVTLHAHLLPVALGAVQRGAQLVHFLVGIESWKPLSRLQAIPLRRAARIVAISRHSETEFRKSNPSFANSEIAVCHPGVPDVDGDGDGMEGNYALIVGRMAREERYKGHDLLLEVWNDVRRAYPPATLVVVGEGDDRLRLEEKARNLDLENAVRFAGRVSDEELDRLYRDCAFFVMPSRNEGFGFAFLEAMRAAKACIGARGAASEIIREGETGFVIEPDDAAELTAAILRLWTDRSLRARLGGAGKERFRSCFTRDRFEERLGRLLTGGVMRRRE